MRREAEETEWNADLPPSKGEREDKKLGVGRLGGSVD